MNEVIVVVDGKALVEKGKGNNGNFMVGIMLDVVLYQQ